VYNLFVEEIIHVCLENYLSADRYAPTMMTAKMEYQKVILSQQLSLSTGRSIMVAYDW